VADDNRQDRQGRTSTKFAAKKAASERIAAARAAQAKAARRRNVMIAGGSTLAVVLVVGLIVVVGLSTKKTLSATAVVAAPTSVTSAITAAATSTLTGTPDITAIGGPPSVLTGAPLTTSAGVPQVLYVGAEYCPNCAATRWPLAIALSRFGTFSNLKTLTSSENSIPTLSFRGSSYTSQYINFDSKEQVDGANRPLEALSATESSLFQNLGGTTSDPTPGYPFIDFGGIWKQNGTSYDPAILKGMTPESVAASLSKDTTKPGSTIKASADVFTAIICQMDAGKPANVCTAAAVVAATAALAGAK
jgi:Domain of unknown function (DUF929)